jgi:hypothetical protein
VGKSLARFLADVAVDSDRLAGFLAEPERSIAEAGLGRRDREALLSGDQGAVLARLQPAEPVPAEPVDDRKENGGMWSWSSPMVDPAAAATGSVWHYAAQDAAGAPMWHYAPASMWHTPGPVWHNAPAPFAAPPPMWSVSVVHVVHHVMGPPPPQPPAEPSGD